MKENLPKSAIIEMDVPLLGLVRAYIQLIFFLLKLEQAIVRRQIFGEDISLCDRIRVVV